VAPRSIIYCECCTHFLLHSALRLRLGLGLGLGLMLEYRVSVELVLALGLALHDKTGALKYMIKQQHN